MIGTQQVPSFVHEAYAQRVVFGAGAARFELVNEIERLGSSRVLVIAADAERQLAAELTAALPVAAVFSDVRMHVPVPVAQAARALAAQARADLLVSVGGGSTTGTAKAVAMTSGLPIVAVPTTYAGSEATPVWGLTEGQRKSTGVDVRVLPRTIVYDPELTTSLPGELSVASGLNALAHCIDSMWAPKANPISSALAVEGTRALAAGLPAVLADGQDVPARSRALYGAYLAAVAFAGAGSGLHHKICHVLGGAYGLPHAPMHAVVLPHVLAFNASAAREAADRVAAALGGSDPMAGLLALYDDLDAPRALRDLGLREGDLGEAARLVVEAAPPSNPRPFGVEDAERLLRQAWAGDRPTVTTTRSSDGRDEPACR